MNASFVRMAFCGILWGGRLAWANEPPVIHHQPITAAVRGQPISVMARVTDAEGPIKYVTLFYALSRDAAPFRVAMKASDADLYIGTIPPDLLSQVDKVLYYIEAMDADEASSETPWHTIEIKKPAPPPAAPAAPAKPPAPPPRERSNLMGIGLIAGGAAAVAGAAVLIANRDDNGPSDSHQYAGVYQGSATECFVTSGAPQVCDTRTLTININDANVVQSPNLRPGTVLTGQLNGNRFLLVADLSAGTNGVTGEIYYHGTVLENELFGQITGRSEGPEGSGVYSGSFNATRR